MISRTVRTEHTFLVSGWYSIYLQYCTPTVDARAEAPGWPGRAGGGRGGAGGGPRAGRGARESRRETRHEFNRVPLVHLYKARPVLVCTGVATVRRRGHATHAPCLALRFSMRRRQLKKPLLFLLWADRAAAGRAVGAACASPSVRLLNPVRPPTSVRPRLSVRPPPARSPSAASAVSADVDDSSARASASDKDWSSWSREADTCCAERSLSAEKRSE